jgi:NitT/TauT family transport system substrate-binding protein
VIIVRQDDLKANPDKYKKFLIGIYKAINYFKTNPDDFIKLSAPHFQLSAADFKASIDGSLVYTSYDETSGFFGKPGAPGTLYGTFDTVMGLNIENGAASTKLSADKAIDNSIIASIKPDDLK